MSRIEAYVGLADDMGIESFMHADVVSPEQINFWALRARCNRHRNAMVYRVWLSKETVDYVRTLFEDDRYLDALVEIQEKAVMTEVEKGMQKAWTEIPKIPYKRQWVPNLDLIKDDPRQGVLPGMEAEE